jgi:uncharacterized protein
MQNSARKCAGYFSRRSGSYRKKYPAHFLPFGILLASYVLSTLFLLTGTAHAYTSPGTPSGYVNDFANVLSEPVEHELQEILRQYAASTTNEIAIATIRSLDGDYIENYAEKLFQEWGVGTSKNNNGVLLLLATEDRQLRIEVGYGLEGAIPDSVADRIIREELVPALKQNNYDGAVTAGVGRIMEAARGEYGADTSFSFSADLSGMAEGILVFGFLALQWLFAILSRTKSWWLGGILGLGLGSIVSSIFGWWLVGGAMLTLGLMLFGFFFDYVVSSTYQHSKKYNVSPPWWAGGSGGFGGRSGGGGFGGFGGGRSGGGGASGRW